jgi:hypothetical protein
VRPELLAAALTGIRRERWRAEQSFDLAFNVVVSLAVVCALGVVGLMLPDLGLRAYIVEAMALLVDRARPALPVYGLATGLVAVTLGVWWWAERGFEV